jgi:transcriptional regulator with XRE-family HTH domain
MAHERPEFLPLGRLVAEQRHRLCLSQTDAVRRVHNAAKAEGRQSGATKQWISEIERTGRIPQPDALRWLAAAIEVPIERIVTAADEQRRHRRPDVTASRLAEQGRALQNTASPPPPLAGDLSVPIKNGVANGVSSDAAAMNGAASAARPARRARNWPARPAQERGTRAPAGPRNCLARGPLAASMPRVRPRRPPAQATGGDRRR